MTEQRKEYLRKWKEEHREHIREYGRRWMKANRNLNPEKAREYKRQYYRKNAVKECERQRVYAKHNRAKITVRTRDYKKRYARLLRVRVRQNLSKRIWHALDRKIWSVKTMELLGCPLKDFMTYLESRFEVGMTWDNYGKVWHVDHIMPCAIFDLTKPEHQRRCFHFSNLQPLFGRENLRKGAKITTNQYNLL